MRTLLLFLALFTAPLLAAEVSIPAAAAEIDAILARHWQASKVTANPPASDELLVRRTYLDLAGRIPTPREALAFVESTRPDKHATLIADLLSRESYVSHFYNFWADILRFKSYYVNTANVVPAAYEQWIKESLRANKPYDQFARDLLSAKGLAWENGAIGYYHRDPEMPLDNMALTSRVFLGTRIECAQCHDHPFDKWKQTEFYHLAAYTYGNKSVQEALSGVRDAFRRREQVILDDFQKEKSASTDGGKAATQRKEERFAAMEFRTVLNIIRQGIGQLFSPVGLQRDSRAVLKLPRDFEEPNGKPGDVMKPLPLFGPAAEVPPGADPTEVFAKWVTSPENPRFTRVIVNRLWKRMFGAPLTVFFDDLKDGAPSVVPELEPHLEKLMIALRYDMKAFLSVLAHTKSYRASVSREEYDPGTPYAFTGPLLRRMTAEQVWDSLVVLACHEPDALDLSRQKRNQRRIDVSHMAYDAYVAYDGEKLVDLGYSRLQGEKALTQRETVAREAAIVAKRAGDKARDTELRREQGRLTRERNEAYVREFMRPLMLNLARQKGGGESAIAEDETYKMNANPAVLAVETWRKTYLPGYGPRPSTQAELAAAAVGEKKRLAALADRLGIPAAEHPAFIAYVERTRGEWLRASELDSPAPRGHFLRTMGQSDREFVENANPNASIPQALAMMNGDILTERNLLSPYSPLMQSIRQASTEAGKVEAAYLAILSRKPTAAEKARWSTPATKPPTIEDLLYALLNTKQFLFIQ